MIFLIFTIVMVDEATIVVGLSVVGIQFNGLSQERLSRFLMATDQVQQAKEQIEKVLEREPRNSRFLTLLGDAYRKQESYSQAINVYSTVALLGVEGAEPYLRAAKVYDEDLKDLKEARKLIEHALRLYPEHARARGELAMLLDRMGKEPAEADLPGRIAMEEELEGGAPRPPSESMIPSPWAIGPSVPILPDTNIGEHRKNLPLPKNSRIYGVK